MSLFYKVAKKTDQNAPAELNNALERFMLNLKDDDFFGGEKPGYADLMIWPWLERFDYIQTYSGFVLASQLSNLTDYIERMRLVPACQELLIETEVHKCFYDSYINGQNPDYDSGN